MSPETPCLSCGACCACFRVSFHWLEADPGVENAVPAELTEELPPHRLCMRGTNQKDPQCVALSGQIGAAVFCAIYQNRPSPCREFGVQYIDGQFRIAEEELERCNHARALWNLSPLSFAALSFAPRPEIQETMIPPPLWNDLPPDLLLGAGIVP